ncbi:MAG TPA: NTP transferase domain-containing protein [bacterium]|nr:NTP transferase domain-containing protein [bacterium]
MRPIAVVLLAAGKGTRMKSELAKVRHPLCGRPMIYYSVAAALSLKPQRLVTVIGHQGEQVRAEVQALFPKAAIDFAVQKTQDGTGHAVWQAKRALRDYDGDVLILSGDVPLLRADTLREFRRLHNKTGMDMSVLATIMSDPTGYGRCVVGEGGLLDEIVEERDATPVQRQIDIVNAGIYLVDAKLLWWALGRIGKDNAQGELYLTDAIKLARAHGKAVRAFIMDESEEVLGINSRVELAEAAEMIRGEIVFHLMTEGVTAIDPHATYLDVGVKVGRDTVLEPGVILRGATSVGEGCTIGAGAQIVDCTIGANASIGPYAVLRGVKIKTGETVAPHEVRVK